MTDREKIIERFKKNVLGKRPETEDSNQKHSGKDGHWLEKAMGITHNRNNAPDLLGYEMKNETRSKTSFGDWSADYYIYRDGPYPLLDRTGFIRAFGKPNPKKGGRFSWSGEPIPTVSRASPHNGSVILFDHEGAAYSIVYSYSRDPRPNKSTLVPKNLQVDNLVLASWSRSNLEGKLTQKFSQKGWFRVVKDLSGAYSKIEFGDPMCFDNWMDLVKKGIVFFDSGMYEGNSRNYSLWRANNNYWDSLIVSSYP